MLDVEKLKELREKGLITQNEFELQEKALFRKTILSIDRKSGEKNGIIYIISAWFLGLIGIHNFYAGYFGRGVVQLTFTLLSWLFMFIPLLIVGIWVFFEILFVGKSANGVAFKGNRILIISLKIIAVLWLFSSFYYADMSYFSMEYFRAENLNP